jgi:hypothetical protein
MTTTDSEVRNIFGTRMHPSFQGDCAVPTLHLTVCGLAPVTNDPWPLCRIHRRQLEQYIDAGIWRWREAEREAARAARMARAERSVVYFFQRSDGLVKIGTTTLLRDRQRSLTREFGDLVLLGLQRGDSSDERDLHRRFAAARVQGEWFRPIPELLGYAVALRQAEAQ